MFKIIYMKADFEPWWKLEGWEENIISEKNYNTKEELEKGLTELLNEFRNKFQYEECREGKYFAFWSEDEQYYCEACDEEAQIFHGIIVEEVEYNNK
ncbi:MAG: DUF1033 family protein [Lysinibacillus sp.]|nr:DUF1033 family protein [Lysinibacillus sp.]